MKLLGILLLITVNHLHFTLGLWPIPRSLETGSTLLKLADGFDITIDVDDAPQDLVDAVSRAKTLLQTDKLQLLDPDRGESYRGNLSSAQTLPGLVLSLVEGSPPARPISTESTDDILRRDEGYSLSVPSDGSVANITSNTTLGLFRGLTTFGQMWYDLDGITYTISAPVTIVYDAPAFPYRGFMLDTARHFFPVSDIKRTLDAMSWVKMSAFHWHITDEQSWPLGITKFPELAEKGAYSAEETFSPDDIQDIVAYAAARGIDVVMEIDIPGHTGSIGYSHPEHIACFNELDPLFGGRPAGQLRVASNATVNFTLDVLSSAATPLLSKLFATGGDEVVQYCYDQDEQTQQDLASSGRTLEEAVNDFVDATHEMLRGIGKAPVVWEEMVLDYNITLKNDTIVMLVPIGSLGIITFLMNVREGYGGHLNMQPPLFPKMFISYTRRLIISISSNSSCDPFKTWRWVYSFDPYADIVPEKQHLVLGGQSLLWTEQSGPENLDPIVWPRAASSAEVFWTGAVLPDGTPRLDGIYGNITTKIDFLARMHDIRERLVRRGVRAINIQPKWCALRPELCTA
ncbi:Glucosamine-6-phosphate isomerase (Glucosamine-6-phosphate deaminase) (GNPDA) (GlcN6P deaminase) [Paramarasmius palmivorus]|uniref:Beta-hexosaminidase n=1 Tax=Paramarasmius palmivorus TaxID=297713 RepID=A0AAW0DS30_9AGAR